MFNVFEIFYKEKTMSLDKSIDSGKEHRKKYYGAKSVSKQCRNHGACDYCRNGRLCSIHKKQQSMIDKIKDFLDEEE